jgi:hypothetical protein
MRDDTRSACKEKLSTHFSTKSQLFSNSLPASATNVCPPTRAHLSQFFAREASMSNSKFVSAGRQRGQGMSEYIIITALVAVAGIGLFAAFGDVLQNQMAGMSREMAGQSASQDISDAQASATTAQNRAAQADSLSNYNQQTNAAQ